MRSARATSRPRRRSRVTRDTVVGALGIRYRRPRPFDEHETSVLLTLAELCTQALERARLFAAERRARADAETANRAKDEFLAMLGHELRNPLAPISTAVQLMKLRSDERSQREREVIERQLQHLTALVDDLLDVSRIARGRIEIARQPVVIVGVVAKALEMARPLLDERDHRIVEDLLDVARIDSGTLTVNPEPIELASVLDDAYELHRSLASEKTISIVRQYASPMGAVLADRDRIAQVLSNLIGNALKFTPAGGTVRLGATLETDAATVYVTDSGPGIPHDNLVHVFDRFW